MVGEQVNNWFYWLHSHLAVRSMSENEFTLMNSVKWWLLIPFPSPQGSYERNCVCQLWSAPSGFWRADGVASMPHEENYHTSPITCANLWSRVCVHKVAPWRRCLGWPWAWLLSPDTWAIYCCRMPTCGCDASPAKTNYSYGHNCAVCQILFHCWAHSQTHFLLLLTAWQPQVDCAPLAPLDRTCGGTSAAGGLRSTRCSGDPGFTRLLSLSWNMQRQ